jgi:hypothetical protein
MENSSKKIKLEPENDFKNFSGSQQEIFLQDQKVKKDPEGNFLFLPLESPKMPNLRLPIKFIMKTQTLRGTYNDTILFKL